MNPDLSTATLQHAPLDCKVCGKAAPYYGSIDFNKHFADPDLLRTAPRGLGIYYYRCTNCGLMFTPDFDAWTPADFTREIYNADYILYDPDYAGKRDDEGAQIAEIVAGLVGGKRILDYGSGKGQMAELLRLKGFDAVAYDPLTATARPTGQFDVVSAIEVIEHSPAPKTTFEEMISYLRKGGALVFSTYCLPQNLPEGLRQPYIAPRNGHVTIHTRASLNNLAASFGFTIKHIDDLLHIAFNPAETPEFLQQ